MPPKMFIRKSFDCIFEGKSINCIVNIFAPSAKKEQIYSCKIEFKGFEKFNAEIRGVDEFNAVQCSIDYAETVFKNIDF